MAVCIEDLQERCRRLALSNAQFAIEVRNLRGKVYRLEDDLGRVLAWFEAQNECLPPSEYVAQEGTP